MYTYTLKNFFQDLLSKKIERKRQFKQSGPELHTGGLVTAGAIVCSVLPFAPFGTACVPSPTLAEHPQCCARCVFFYSGSQTAAFLLISIYVSAALYSADHPLTGPCQ